ncbi:MAG: hypothetical protein L0312_34030, partial [Acidobacteria bacterium]|nr:hypothetical protein [Acidobacteriota bacterium]
IGGFDGNRVEDFWGKFMKLTWKGSLEQRRQKLDQWIADAGLSLADKVEVLRRISPRLSATIERNELRMECLIRSVALEDLPLFKFALDYDGDDKDMAEYVFHDIDKRHKDIQDRIKAYFRTAPKQIGVKVLTDVDDTMYASLLEERYPKKQLGKDGKEKRVVYPGVLTFYNALKSEPFDVSPIPVTTLSARPKAFEGASLESLVEITENQLRPSALSGELSSSTIGTLESLWRALLNGKLSSHEQEDKIGKVKFENFSHFSEIYPEYGYVFVGDSGQADALTARMMMTEKSPEGTSRVVATFIHDIRKSPDDTDAASFTFTELLKSGLQVNENPSPSRGVIVFRNYIQAAVIAHIHSATLGNLITAEELATITQKALEQFIDFKHNYKKGSGENLQREYREDAGKAYKLLQTANLSAAILGEIRGLLDKLDKTAIK